MKNKCVLITGSSRGLGKELALVFASNNHDIILHGRNKKDLEKVKQRISKIGVNCYIICGDLKLDKTIEKIYRLAKGKNVSVLINNAGIHCPSLPLEEIKDEQIDDIITVNLIAPMKLTKRVYTLFLDKNHGTVININSLSGLESRELRSIYGASKWGLRGFTNIFRLEAEKNNVRVIGVYPSGIKTKPRFTSGMDPQKVAQKIYSAYRNKSISKIKLDGRGEK